MSTGFWLNQDGLPLQFGTQKAIPEMGGDYLIYGENREIETYISLAGYTVGSGVQLPGLPSSFSGTTTPIAAGIQSMTTMFPLQITAPVTTASGGAGLVLTNPQLWVDTIELQCLVTANAGTGGATGLTGIGLAYATSPPAGTASTFVQVVDTVGAGNTGVQFLGSTLNAAMTAGAVYTFRSNANLTAGTGGSGYIQYSTANTATVTAGKWLGNVPQVVSFQNGVSGALPNQAFISAIAAGGTYSGTTAAGLLKLRIKYTIYGAINY